MDRFNLGPHARTISTTVSRSAALVQPGFELVLRLQQGGSASSASARRSSSIPECVMAHWGMAYAAGPFYNLAWREYGEQEANAATRLACDHIAKARALGRACHRRREQAGRGHRPAHPEAACRSAGRVRPLGRRLRRRDAAHPFQPSRRPGRGSALHRGADHAHAPASMGRQDRTAGEGLRHRGGSAGLRALDAARRRAGRDAASGDPAPLYPCARDVEHAASSACARPTCSRRCAPTPGT